MDAEDVVKLAVGPTKAPDLSFSSWERILAEIIVGDAFGVDRMDYLLRDSLHAGVAYGNFGHHRLIGTLKILPLSADDDSERELSLGVELGGLRSAEALLMARYFMYSQVYFHRVRMIYDQHLVDFLTEWLEGGQFSIDTNTHLSITDNEVTGAFLSVARDKTKPGHNWAKILSGREHFRVLYSRLPQDVERDPDVAFTLGQAARDQFGDKVRYARRFDKGGAVEFPVLMDDGKTPSSKAVSKVLRQIPVITEEYVYVDRSILRDAERWRDKELDQLRRTKSEERKEP